MTKDEVLQIINAQKIKIKDLQEQVMKLTQVSEETIKKSALYRELQEENVKLREDAAFYKASAKSSEASAAQRKARLKKLKSECDSLMADNQRMAEEHAVSYWIGMTENSNAGIKQMERNYNDLMVKYTVLEEKYASADRYAKHLENQINDYLFALRPDEKPAPHPEKAVVRSRRAGRPRKATQVQIAEARAWRREGLSIREIARRTEDLWGAEQSWSVGYVQKMVGNVECTNK